MPESEAPKRASGLVAHEPGPEHEARLLEHVERLDAVRFAQRLYGLGATEARTRVDEPSGRTERVTAQSRPTTSSTMAVRSKSFGV
jgi:hypothetical protein